MVQAGGFTGLAAAPRPLTCPAAADTPPGAGSACLAEWWREPTRDPKALIAPLPRMLLLFRRSKADRDVLEVHTPRSRRRRVFFCQIDVGRDRAPSLGQKYPYRTQAGCVISESHHRTQERRMHSHASRQYRWQVRVPTPNVPDTVQTTPGHSQRTQAQPLAAACAVHAPASIPLSRHRTRIEFPLSQFSSIDISHTPTQREAA